MLKIIPIFKKFAPNAKMPPLPNINAWNNRAMKDTIEALNGPKIKTARGMMKKCIGIPIGDGMVMEVATTVTVVNTPVNTNLSPKFTFLVV